jgi:hypothetical protein
MMSSILISLFALSPAAHAEGSAELPGQWLLVDNVLYVDIVDTDAERIGWQGVGGVVVRAPDGTDLGVLPAGGELPLNGLPVGAYQLRFQSEQRGDWNVTVPGATDTGGRLFSYDWMLDARGYDGAYGFDGRFYARVDGGEDGRSGILTVDLAGWTGYRWTAMATDHGVEGDDGGRSVDRYLAEVEPHIPLYLSPPSLVGDAPVTPDASGLVFEVNERSDEFGGVFRFNVSHRGTWRVVCDGSADGSVDPTANHNVVLSGVSEGAEEIEVEWDGHTWDGGYISGSGECGVTLSVGELHFLADDIETAFPGLRTYVHRGGSDTPSPMFWNDSEVVFTDVPMDNGEASLEASGPDGVLPNDLSGTPEPNTSARAWGDFDDEGKGDRNMLDTWTFLDRSDPFIVNVDDFGGPGDRNDTTNDLGTGAEEPELEEQVEEEAASGFYKGGCTQVGGVASSAGFLALVAGMASFGLRRRED